MFRVETLKWIYIIDTNLKVLNDARKRTADGEKVFFSSTINFKLTLTFLKT